MPTCPLNHPLTASSTCFFCVEAMTRPWAYRFGAAVTAYSHPGEYIASPFEEEDVD